MGAWMITSVIMMAIIASILTSAIIVLSVDHANTIKSPKEMHLKKVGFLKSHHSSEFSIQMAGGLPVVFDEVQHALAALEKEEISYLVMSRTAISDYLLTHKNESIVLMNVSVGYESWVILLNHQLDGKFYQKIKYKMINFIEKGKLYPICSKYLLYPENCITI